MVGKFVQTKTWDMSSRRCMFRVPFWAWPTSHFYCFFFTATFLLFSATSAKTSGYVEEVLFPWRLQFIRLRNKQTCLYVLVCVVMVWPASPFLHSLPCREGSGGGKPMEMWWWQYWKQCIDGKKTRQIWWWGENKRNVVEAVVVVVKEERIEMWGDFTYFKQLYGHSWNLCP